MTSTSQADAVDQIRIHLDLARRRGRRRRGRPALVEATGDHAVRTALDTLKESGDTRPAPAATRRRQLADSPGKATPTPDDRQIDKPTGDFQPVSNAKPAPATSKPSPAAL